MYEPLRIRLCDELINLKYSGSVLDEDEELPPATPLSTQGDGTDTWTIIGSDGEKFTAGNIQRGTRKASITTAQVQKLLEYVKQNAPHLTLKKIKPGVLKLVRIKEKKQPHHHHLSLRKHNYQELKKIEQKDEQNDNYWTIKDTNENEEVKMKSKKKTNSGLLHFDLSDILKDNEDFKPSVVSTEVQKKPKSGNLFYTYWSFTFTLKVALTPI